MIKTTMKYNDWVNPDHYKNKDGTQTIETIQREIENIFEHNPELCFVGFIGYLYGNSVKYTQRAGRKPYEGKSIDESTEIDIEKSNWYLEKMIEIIGIYEKNKNNG